MAIDEYYCDDRYTHVPNVLTPSKETVAHCHSILVLDPYGGCIHQCRFCYVTMGLARIHNQDFSHVIPMRIKMPEKFGNFLKKYSQLKFPIRISSNCDPFQPVEQEMHLTRKLLELCLQYEYPVVLNTKGHISPEMLELLKDLNSLSLLQMQLSLMTIDPQVAGILEPNVPLMERISLANDLLANGIPVTIRFQPIIPEVNSSEHTIQDMLAWCKSAGIRHLIVSFLRITRRDLKRLYSDLQDLCLISDLTMKKILQNDFWESDGFYFHPNYNFREDIVNYIYNYCIENNIFFSTCKEPFREYHTIKDCCGGIYSEFVINWKDDIIEKLPKNIQRIFNNYPQVDYLRKNL
jgi:DNA repair photolyase